MYIAGVKKRDTTKSATRVMYTRLGRAIRLPSGAMVVLQGDVAEVEVKIGECVARLVLGREALLALRAKEKVTIKLLEP